MSQEVIAVSADYSWHLCVLQHTIAYRIADSYAYMQALNTAQCIHATQHKRSQLTEPQQLCDATLVKRLN
jgi:hypothetical protein